MRAFKNFGDRGHAAFLMLQTTESYKKLAKISENIVNQLNKYPGLAMITKFKPR